MNSTLGLNSFVLKVTQRDSITLHKGVVDLEEVEQRDLVQFICHLFVKRINIGRNRKTITEGDSLEASAAYLLVDQLHKRSFVGRLTILVD